MSNQFLHFEHNASQDLTFNGSPSLNVDMAAYRALTFNDYPASRPNVISADGSLLMIPPLDAVGGGGGGTTTAGSTSFEQLLPGSFTPVTAGATGDQNVTPVTTPATGDQSVTPTSPTGAATTTAEAQTAQPQATQAQAYRPGIAPNGQPIPGWIPDPFSPDGSPAMVPMWMRLAPSWMQPGLIQQWQATMYPENNGSQTNGQPTGSDTSGTQAGSGQTSDTTGQTQDTTGQPQDTTGLAATNNGTTQPFSTLLGNVGNQALTAPQSATDITNPNSYFLSQLQPDAASNNENCGPTSLAMACEAFGAAQPSSDPEKLIEGVRQLMTGQDNVTDPTNYQQIENGARAAGLTAQQVNGLNGINQALASGQMVIAAGNPDRPGAGAYGDSLSNDQYNHFNGRHIILIAGIDSSTGNYVINDPLSKVGSLEVNAQQLQAFLSDPTQPADNGGIAVGRPNGANPTTMLASNGTPVG